MMSFQQRSSPGQHHRLPRPEVIYDAESRFLLVATTWGKPEAGRKVAQTIADYFLSSRNDKDATSPFRKLEHLSTMANNLRIAALVGSEMLYREENKAEYTCGLELFAAYKFEEELTYLQVGQPSVILARKGMGVMPLSVRMNLSGELALGNQELPPLPGNLLGVSAEPAMTIETFRPQDQDRMILLSQSWIPKAFMDIQEPDINLESISQALSAEQKPYWIGLWSV